jgi:beta-N-acetylhexosaminidase
MARLIGEKSITLVKDSLNQVPLTGAKNLRVLSVVVGRRSDLGAGVAFNSELREGVKSLRTDFLATEDPNADYSRIAREADSADVVIVSSYVGQVWDALSASAPEAFASFVQGFAAKGKRLVVITFGNPYFLQQVPAVPAYVVAWGRFPPSQIAAARALLGKQPLTGKLPISIPLKNTVVKRGTGILRGAGSQ